MQPNPMQPEMQPFALRHFSLAAAHHRSLTPGTVARLAPLPTGFSRQENRGGLLYPPPGGLPDPGIKPVSLRSPVALEVKPIHKSTNFYLNAVGHQSYDGQPRLGLLLPLVSGGESQCFVQE